MPAEKPRFRDIIGAPNPLRYTQIWDTGLKDALMYFDPDSFSVLERENSMKSAPKQTQCGQCYFWAMKQPACMAFRICLFWSILCKPYLLRTGAGLRGWQDDHAEKDPEESQTGSGQVTYIYPLYLSN